MNYPGYRCEGLGSIAEQIAGQAPQTQFGRAMEQLGVELILANSPQAKGRVERMNGVLQDRLVKALRLAGIKDVAAANAYWAQTYLAEHHRKFAVPAASEADAHQGVPRRLDEILSWEAERVVQRDWTVAHAGNWYQLDRQHEALRLAGKKVIVRRLRGWDGAAGARWREAPVASVAGAPRARAPQAGQGSRGEAAHGGLETCGGPSVAAAADREREEAATTSGKGTTTHNQRRGHFLLSS